MAERLTLATDLCVEAPDLLLAVTESGAIETANASACATLGYTLEELLAATVFAVAPAFPAQRWDAIWRMVQAEGPVTFDTHFTGRDGRALPVEVTARHASGPSGSRLVLWAHDGSRRQELESHLLRTQEELLGRVRDVTVELARVNGELRNENAERREVEANLRAWEQTSRMITDHVTDVVWSCDLKGRLTYVSPSIQRLLGHSPHELVSTPVQELLSLEATALATRHLEGLGDEDQASAQVLELEIMHRHGHPVACETTLRFLLDPSGQRVGLVGTTRDVSERKRMEATLIGSERMAALGTLVGGIAHEFNNLNTIIAGNAHLVLKDVDLGEATRRRMGAVQAAALRGGTIAADLIAFGGQCTRDLKPGNLSAAATQAVQLVAGPIEREDIALVLRLGDTPDTLLAEAQMTQVILNLLGNARHALLDRPVKRIELETGTQGSTVYLKVIDTGCGIPRAHLSQVFTPFFSTKGEHAEALSPQGQVRGTGLGLSVSSTIVANHGGTLTVQSQADVGSTFTISLPRRSAAAGSLPPAGPSSASLNPLARPA